MGVCNANKSAYAPTLTKKPVSRGGAILRLKNYDTHSSENLKDRRDPKENTGGVNT